MVDPLAEVITLLKPRTVFSKVVSGAGSWAVRYPEFGEPSFCAMLDGECTLAVEGQQPVLLKAGDFVLLPATPGFTLSSSDTVIPILMDPASAAARGNQLRHGRQDGPVETRMLGGYFAFDSPDSALLVSLLPALMHVRGVERLKLLVQMVRDESLQHQPGRELVLGRLVEILLVETLRSTSSHAAAPGLLLGLADPRLGAAIRHMHENPQYPWTVGELAVKAALSRSAFFDRFSRGVGMAPMEYLLTWRMALAKDLLRQKKFALVEIAEKIGYGSASSFSTAFSRHVGIPPGAYGLTATASAPS
ncbi:AraC family transcriptional regulator [Pseudoduganella umbonata]|uniref:AraC family transcriptional regulator n=1 Tax=Pseudoduganella umbonata TaxID=864828 RepID=A0A4P8HUA9_9BURK|nr:AraC family transcriptional regulator [Pseudoduganella umbonata]MBB3223561.1 AraC-like DNA-binding protein [Pseudoduganella umbonata]QCP13567.1 AraC family transcriptional regulator [Pseudoduganella umbonata]